VLRRRVLRRRTARAEPGRLGVRARLPARPARGPGAGLVHAAGRPVTARVQAGPRRHRNAGQLCPAGPGGRDHPAAGPPLRRRRGHPLLRHHGAAEGGRGGPRHRAGPGPGGGAAAGRRSRPGRAAAAPARRRGLRHRGGADPGPRTGPDTPDRLRRRPVHAGQLPDRGRPEQGLRQDQGDDGRPPGAVGPALHGAGRHRRGLSGGPGRGRRQRGTALRLLGRQPVRRRLRPVRPAVLGPRAAAVGRPRRAPDPLRRRHLGAAGSDGTGGGRRGWGRLADAAGRGQPADRTRLRRPGQPGPGPAGRAVAGAGRAGTRGRPLGCRSARARVQPRSRRSPGDRPGGAWPDRRAGAGRRAGAAPRRPGAGRPGGRRRPFV
ncbi:MAG: Uroporphyrinogen III decarboxylase, partial [uncultured Friedmanniella sp.]